MKSITHVFIFIAIIFLNTATASADSYPAELLFCIADWHPYEYMEGNQAKGVNVETFEAVANSLGIAVKWVAYPWTRCVYMAKHGLADGLMSLYKSAEREEFLYYPDENVNIDECVFVTYTGSHVIFDGTLKSLTGENVLVAQANSYGEEFDKATNFTKKMAPSQNNVVIMVANKRYKIGIGSRKRFEDTIKEKALADKVIVLDPPYRIKTYFAFTRKKGVLYKALAKDISEALANFKSSEEYRGILKKYGFISQ